jgi:hypothetical protein
MRSEHRAPLIASLIVVLACVGVVAHAMRTDALGGLAERLPMGMIAAPVLHHRAAEPQPETNAESDTSAEAASAAGLAVGGPASTERADARAISSEREAPTRNTDRSVEPPAGRGPDTPTDPGSPSTGPQSTGPHPTDPAAHGRGYGRSGDARGHRPGPPPGAGQASEPSQGPGRGHSQGHSQGHGRGHTQGSGWGRGEQGRGPQDQHPHDQHGRGPHGQGTHGQGPHDPGQPGPADPEHGPPDHAAGGRGRG